MAGSTISGAVTVGVTLGNASYPSPLTITPTGLITPSGYMATGLSATISSGFVLNQGTISGGSGYVDHVGAYPSGPGGIGLKLIGDSLTNDGTIIGGTGGYGPGDNYGGHNAGTGGYGLFIASDNLSNNGTIIGGTGGYGAATFGGAENGHGGNGGAGIRVVPSFDYGLAGPVSLTIDGVVLGGRGGMGASGTLAGFHGNPANGGIGIEFPGVVYNPGPGDSLTVGGVVVGGYGYYGGYGASLGDVALTNNGTIDGASGKSMGGIGVRLAAGPLANSGQITGGSAGTGNGGDGVYLSQGAMTNSGGITGGSGGTGGHYGEHGGVGVYFGLLGGGVGVPGAGAFALTNTGSITGGGALSGDGAAGVYLSDGRLINDGTIIGGSGATGVIVRGGTTLIDAGFIGGGGAADAVRVSTGSAKVILDPGATFNGIVDGGASAASTLDLASAAGTGSLSGLGTSYIGFGGITIASGASWTLTGTNTINAGATLTNSGTLTLLGANFGIGGGLVNNGIIAIDPSTMTTTGIVGSGTIEIGADSTLTINGSVTAGETFVFTGTNAVLNILAAAAFHGTIEGQGPTDQVNISCFAAGTRIRTRRGNVAVEDLIEGDMVATAIHGIEAPVMWIGRRTVDCVRHAQPRNVWPVRVAAGAFGPGLPARDLLLSPDHAVFWDEVLIPIKHLINGSSIAQRPMNVVVYYHVELPRHDIVFAEGLPTESYLDTGDRANFGNGASTIVLHPDFSTHVREAEGCAPLLVAGPRVDAVRHWAKLQATGLCYEASATAASLAGGHP